MSLTGLDLATATRDFILVKEWFHRMATDEQNLFINLFKNGGSIKINNMKTDGFKWETNLDWDKLWGIMSANTPLAKEIRDIFRALCPS
jgi:hypothetical protein